MTALARRVDRWLFAPLPARRLAALRILLGTFATGYLLVRLPAFLALADRRPEDFDGVGILRPVSAAFPDGLWYALLAVTVVSGALFTAGVAWRVSGPGFALAMLAATSYRSSWGQLLHFENLLVLHLLIIGWSSAADALTPAHRDATPVPADERYGWPLRLAALVTVATYVVAGVAKLRIGGIDWVTGDALRHHLAYSAMRLDLLGEIPSPLARPLVAITWLAPPLALATIALELGAPLALLGRRLRWGWVAAIWSMHLAIAATMFVVFPYPISLVAFAPMLLDGPRPVDPDAGDGDPDRPDEQR